MWRYRLLKLGTIVGTLAIGFIGIIASCIYMENPWGVDELYYGYPLLWLNTSKSLLFSFPPIPVRASILWVGFIFDILLYCSGGFVVSFLVLNLKENMKLLRFFIKSGVVFFVCSYLVGFFLVGSGLQLGPGVFPPYEAGLIALFFWAAATPVCTIAYGYYQLLKKRRAMKVSA
jgi:hypothetical protein